MDFIDQGDIETIEDVKKINLRGELVQDGDSWGYEMVVTMPSGRKCSKSDSGFLTQQDAIDALETLAEGAYATIMAAAKSMKDVARVTVEHNGPYKVGEKNGSH